jgi:hypothetical protein
MVCFQTKIHIWVNYGGSWNGKGWYILWQFRIHLGHLVYFMVIWYFSGSLVYFSPFWYIK